MTDSNVNSASGAADDQNGSERKDYGGKRQRIEGPNTSLTTAITSSTQTSSPSPPPLSSAAVATTTVSTVDESSVAKISEFIDSLQDYEPTIPDEVISSILRTTGCDINDTKLLRLISLSAQRFIFNIAEDAQQVSRLRARQSTDNKEKSSELTMDDLSIALSYQGIQVNKPMYYADHIETNTES